MTRHPSAAAEVDALTIAFQQLRAVGVGPSRAELTYQQTLPVIRRWARAYLRRRFRWNPFEHLTATYAALADDALQHLLEAVLLGKASVAAGADLCVFVAWCKRVLDNFVISEFRCSVRPPPPVATRHPLDPDSCCEAREALVRLAALLRHEILRSARRQDRAQRLALFDEFLSSVLHAEQGAARPGSRSLRYQRSSRGRRLACRAWVALLATDRSVADLRETATALGLERRPSDAAVRKSSSPAFVSVRYPRNTGESVRPPAGAPIHAFGTEDEEHAET
jgi:hypothetical protein